MEADWEIREARGEELARCVDFFLANVDVEFISHAELMSGRALDSRTWSPRLKEILSAELASALGREWPQPRQAAAAKGGATGLALAEEGGGRLVGIAYYGIEDGGSLRYGMLYDLIVSRDRREEGWGPRLLGYVEARMRLAKVGRLYLESGKENRRAHRFFEREGFEQLSIVMAKALDA